MRYTSSKAAFSSAARENSLYLSLPQKMDRFLLSICISSSSLAPFLSLSRFRLLVDIIRILLFSRGSGRTGGFPWEAKYSRIPRTLTECLQHTGLSPSKLGTNGGFRRSRTLYSENRLISRPKSIDPSATPPAAGHESDEAEAMPSDVCMAGEIISRPHPLLCALS